MGIVARDSSEQPAPGRYSICYVNGFQTQPGDQWPDTLVLHDASGSDVADRGWPDERILDISTPAKRAAIVEALAPTVHRCAVRGVPGGRVRQSRLVYGSNGAFDLAAAGPRDTAGRTGTGRNSLRDRRTPELGRRGPADIGFDFAVAEECRRFDECTAYTDVYGDYVIDIRYIDDLGAPWPRCAPTRSYRGPA